MSVITAIEKLEWEWRRENPWGKPSHLLLHPNVARFIKNQIGGALIYDKEAVGKPARIGGLELVEVNPHTHPEDYIKVVGVSNIGRVTAEELLKGIQNGG